MTRPCFSSCFGLPLQTTVIIVGIIELVITIIATFLNVVKLTRKIDTEGEECEGKDICIGPLIKYSVFDASFGVLLAFCLIFGGYLRNHCLLVTWMIFTVIASLKYIWVVVTHDWTSLEDWIAITYLSFYASVFMIVISFMCEMGEARLQGGAFYPTQPSVVINQTFMPTTPPGYPQNGNPPPYQQQAPANPGYFK